MNEPTWKPGDIVELTGGTCPDCTPSERVMLRRFVRGNGEAELWLVQYLDCPESEALYELWISKKK